MMKILSKELFVQCWFFLIQLIVALVLYLMGINLYATLSNEPIFFFASCYLAAIIAIALGMIIGTLFKKYFNIFTTLLMSGCSAMVIIIFAIFGPVFIDRSISYHIAFYVAEQGNINIAEIENTMSKSIFKKRIKEAQASGFIAQNPDGIISPTTKGKIFTKLMIPLGKWSHSLENYQAMKSQLIND